MADTVDRSMWRTLIVVVRVRSDGLVVRIPAWRPRAHILIRKDVLPKRILDACDGAPTTGRTERYLHARCNIGAEEGADLRFSCWELS